MNNVNTAAITLCLLAALPMAVSAQSTSVDRDSERSTSVGPHSERSPSVGPEEGEREFSISGTGSNDRDFNSGSAGVTGDLGWYLRDNTVVGIRQSVNYANIEGEGVSDDFWNGSTRGYVNYQFLDDRARPFIGASLGGIYGDGVNDGGFAGLEAGLKYYVREKTYVLARAEYQFLFDSTDDATDAFQDDGIWAYTVGLGYNF